jgi:argininosuccinate synthase
MSRVMKKVVLAYSGGLDTSVILKWLQETYGCEVIAFCADLGQGEDLQAIKAKAQRLGVKKVYVEDLRETFVKDYVFPMLRGNAIYEGCYLLGTSIARPLIARRQAEIALKEGAEAVSHGATGKGNDQVRFELTYTALAPNLKIIAPWREWTMKSRRELIEYADRHGIPITATKAKPYSMDLNLFHVSYEGGILEDPWEAPPDEIFQMTVSPEQAPDMPLEVEIGYEDGNPVSVDGKKTRGVYETPGGTILHVAHRGLESLTMDREVLHFRDSMIPRFADLIYNGYWFSPEREMIQASIDAAQKDVTGTARVKLYKGSCTLAGRKSKHSLYRLDIATFEEDEVYNQKDAEGFIRLNALRLKIRAQRKKASS